MFHTAVDALEKTLLEGCVNDVLATMYYSRQIAMILWNSLATKRLDRSFLDCGNPQICELVLSWLGTKNWGAVGS